MSFMFSLFEKLPDDLRVNILDVGAALDEPPPYHRDRPGHQRQARKPEPMIRTTTLTMVDGVRVVVPDSLDLITPYVLREQEDWFEDEIKFVRRVLRPGQSVIDVGANYGVYTLSMARAVGPQGHVWAFEPASGTADLLAQGIAANGFAHVTLERSALSSTAGTAQLSLHQNSELNSVLHDAPPMGPSETVPLVTLDGCLDKFGWCDIEFVKLDAEGEEANILKGGLRFFGELSPLVQYEVRAGEDVHLDLMKAFAELGYISYRLVPGLDVLVRCEVGSHLDAFQLNLFCCKADRAARLVARDLLVDSIAGSRIARKPRLAELLDRLARRDAHDWRHDLLRFPYGARLADLWERTVSGANGRTLEGALALYARSRNRSRSAAERFGALQASLDRLRTLCAREPAHLRLSSLARVAREYGARSIAIEALVQLIDTIKRQGRADLNEPFLPPGERFDALPPGDAVGDWVLAASLEELERLGSFSSFYTGTSARERLEVIRDLGFGGPEMQRRLSLLDAHAGLASHE